MSYGEEELVMKMKAAMALYISDFSTKKRGDPRRDLPVTVAKQCMWHSYLKPAYYCSMGLWGRFQINSIRRSFSSQEIKSA